MQNSRVPPLRGEPTAANAAPPIVDDMRHRRNGLGVVDDRGSAVETHDSREGRLDARNAALAFERLHQRRLFAHFVCARAGLRDDLKFGVGSEDVLAQKALRVRVGNGLLHDLEQIAILAAQIDEAHLRADGQAGNDGSFNHRMGIVQKNQVILAGARFALVAIHQHILWLGATAWARTTTSCRSESLRRRARAGSRPSSRR